LQQDNGINYKNDTPIINVMHYVIVLNECIKNTYFKFCKKKKKTQITKK